MKRHPKTKNEEYIIILKKLASAKHNLERKDFEIPKVKGKPIWEEIKPDNSIKNYVPHSTLIMRLKELKEIEAITEIDSGKKAKTGLTIPSYQLTFIGMMKLLQLCDEKKFDLDVFYNLRFLDAVQYQPSKRIFSNKQIFENLIRIAKNITIIVKQESKTNEGNFDKLLEHGFTQLVTTSEIMSDKEDRIICYITIKGNYQKFSYMWKERIPIYGREENNILFKPRDIDRIGKIITGVFYDELIQRCNNSELYPKKCTLGSGMSLIIKVIREDKALNETFLEYIEEMNQRFETQKEYLTNIRSSVTKLN